MPVEELNRLVASGRVVAPNYFNGRLLSAGDLRQERVSGRELLARVARGVGAGIAFGFEVTAVPAVAGTPRRSVLIRAGLALGPYGDALQLDDDTELNVISVARPGVAPAPTTAVAPGFRRCAPAPLGAPEVTNPGLYLLAVGPASGSDGAVATSGLASAPAACAIGNEISGLRFVMLPFRAGVEGILKADAKLAPNTVPDAAAQSRFRSRVARACFVPAPVFPPALGLPPAAGSPFGALATLTDPALPACHVPLAVVRAGDGTIEFVDMWAARRELEPPSAAGNWAPWLSDRGSARTDAEVCQFQEHLASVLTESADASTVQAKDYFEYLPPFGVVPIAKDAFRGFDADKFFAGRASALFPGRHTGAGGVLTYLPRLDSDEAAELVRAVRGTPAEPNVDGLYLQRYLIVTNGGPGPTQVLFALRDTHGPVEDDDVADVLRDTADAYSGVLGEAVLMPRPLTELLIFGWAKLQALQLAVVQSAGLDAVAAGLRGLDQAGVLDAFGRLYRVQKALANGALLGLPNDKNQSTRHAQAARLVQLLDGPSDTDVLALKPSLDATPPLIPTILAAQNAINAVVRTWTAVELIGVSVTFQGSSPIPVVADRAAQFKFTAQSLVSAPVSLVPSVRYPERTPSPWLASATFVQENGTTPLEGGRLDLPPGEKRSFVMLLKAPATPTVPPLVDGTGIDYIVNVTSNDVPAVTGSSGILTFVVGRTPPAPDENVTLAPGPASSPRLSDGTIKCPPNIPKVTINIQATFAKAGTYVIGDPVVTGAGWAAVRSTGTPPEITVAAPDGASLFYTVSTGADPAAVGAVEFPVRTKGGTASPAKIRYSLVRG